MDAPAPARALATLDERQRARALDRFGLLRPALEEGMPLARVARDAALPLRTAQRWFAAYRHHGLAGLAPRPRGDRGHCHKLPATLERLVEGLALERPARPLSAIHRLAAEVAATRGWPGPSYAQVYGIVRRLDPALATLAHGGDRAYREAYDLLHRHEAAGPNAVWQADHTHLDIWLRDERDQPAKPWLTAVLDDFSRAIMGYYLGFAEPSMAQTALALRTAIRQKGDAHWPTCGIPGVFYADHGPDFTSRHLEQVAADLKVRLVHSTKGEPRGRGKIERFFETVGQLLLAGLPGYAPPGSPPAEPSLTLPAFERLFHAWLLDTYHRRIHGETKQPPLARWEAGGFLPRLPAASEDLDLLLLTVAKPRRVHQDGIHFQGLRYLDTTLAAYIGEDAVVRYDPRDLAELRVYYRDTYLCRAICPEIAGETIALKDIIRARRHRRKELRGQLRDRAAIVDELLALHRRDLASPDDAAPVSPPAPEMADARPRLKRYLNE